MLTSRVAQSLMATSDTIVLSIAGAQGTGKSTLANLVALMLRECFSASVAVLSLDDFYLPRMDRERLAATVHPLLQTRGVPGTHDAVLMTEVLTALRQGASVQLPRFDKASDDRVGEEFQPAARIIICEGWCWGAIPEPAERLSEPRNALEAEQDSDGRWRRWINDELAGYQPAFAADARLFMAAPSMEAVYRWRWQQEQGLAAERSGTHIMSQSDIHGFVSLYERLTRWMLEEMPGRAELTVRLNESHQIAGLLTHGRPEA